MLSKRQRPYDADELPPGKRLERNIQDLYRNNDVSAQRTQELVNDACEAGVTEFRQHYRKAKAKTKGKGKKRNTNVSRSIRRSFLKGTQWPNAYYAQVRVLSKSTRVEEQQWLAFSLPHEYIAALFRHGNSDVLMGTQNLDKLTQEHLTHCELQAGAKLLPVGLWADGVPCSWDRNETIETVSINLPGLSDEFKALRLPVTGLSKRQVIPATWDDIFDVVSWSFLNAATGRYPDKRHDGTDFTSESDRQRRAKVAGQSMAYKACLAEVRGDWDLFANVFHFPRWRQKSGCCWKCDIKPDEVQQVGRDAAWRGQRNSHNDLMLRILRNGCSISTIFKVPWISSSIFRIDWLHCADLGCTADFMGNLLHLISKKFPGRNHDLRVKALWQRTVQHIFMYSLDMTPRKGNPRRRTPTQEIVDLLVPYLRVYVNIC